MNEINYFKLKLVIKVTQNRIQIKKILFFLIKKISSKKWNSFCIVQIKITFGHMLPRKLWHTRFNFGLGSGVIKKAKLGGVSLKIRNMTFLIIVLIYIGLYPSVLGEEM